MEAEQRAPEPKPGRNDRAERGERSEPTPERAAPAPRRRSTAAAAAAAAAAESRDPAPATPPEPPHEVIRFAPDQRLNIAYNPNCTHEAGAREGFVAEVLGKSEAGARAFCPRCDQQAMRFVRVNTALGLFGIGACERCGYWYLM
jgi:hypothetical protein